MPELPDSSVGLVVTSPPYFAGKEYEKDLAAGHIPSSYLEYLSMLEEVFAECVRKLEPGGRIAVNVANLGRKPYRSLSADVTNILQDKLGLLLRGEVIWQKALGSSGSCAWGSFQRPSNPVLRDVTERVLIAGKGRFDRSISQAERAKAGLPSVSSLSKDEFLEATTDVWHIPPESATRVGHPAPFPVDLPLRLIQLYTYEGDVVLDPFMGSGTTAVAALRSGRRFVGYENDHSYVELSRARLEAEHLRPVEAMSAQGIKNFARDFLLANGFRDVQADVAAGGLEVSFRAEDGAGRTWLFETAGAFSAGRRAGLGKSEIFWKLLGKAALLRATDPAIPFVALATGLPPEKSPVWSALAACCGPQKPLTGVVHLASGQEDAQLRALAENI